MEHINFKQFLSDDGLTSGPVEAIYQDRRGFMWFGTYGGLNRYDGIEFRRFTSDRSDPYSISNDIVWDITEDQQGFLWISTFNGLSRFDPETGSFITFDKEDGLPGNQFNRFSSSWKTRDQELVFGTVDGFVLFQPDLVKRNKQVPPVVITGLELSTKPALPGRPGSPLLKTITETEELSLDYDHAIV